MSVAAVVSASVVAEQETVEAVVSSVAPLAFRRSRGAYACARSLMCLLETRPTAQRREAPSSGAGTGT